MYAGTVRGGVFRTKRDGKSWESIGQGLKRAEVKSLLIHPSGIYAGTGRGVYRWPIDSTLFTMMLMAVPLIILYEIGVLGAKLFGRKTVKSETQDTEDSGVSSETAGERIR